MEKLAAQHSPQSPFSFTTNNSRQIETEFTRFQQVNSTPKLSPEPETDTEEVSLSIQEAEETRISMSPSSQETILDNGRMIEAEQACFLRKTCIILASMIIWIVLTIEETLPQRKLETLGLIAFCCLTYNLFENVIFCMKHNLISNGSKLRLFDIIDGVLALYFLLAIKFSDEEGSSRYLLILSPCICLASVIIYLKMARSNNIKVPLIKGICYAVQISLIAAKLQGYDTLDWITVFVPFGLYLTGYQIYGSYILAKSSIRLYRQVEIEDLSFVRACVRMSCDVVHYGLVFITFGVFIDLWHQATDKEMNESIRLLLAVMQLYSGLSLAFAVIFFKFVREYDPELSENFDEENSTSRIKPEFSREKYSLVPQDGLFICSFLKISPTYFVRVDENPQEMKFQGEEEDKLALRVDEIDEVSCYICEENQPDVIIMGCGHGGMCKGCVLLSMEKNSSCMQCRKPAQSIYLIKNENKDSGMVEACEVFSIDY